MTVEADYKLVGRLGEGPLTDIYKCKKCECLVLRPDRKAHTRKQHLERRTTLDGR